VLSWRETAKLHLASAWKYRWQGLAIAWLLCVVGWTVVVMMPNVYAAKARIYVDTDSMLRPLLRGIAADPNIVSEVDLMQRTLLSRPNLEKVIHAADLDLNVRTNLDRDELITSLQQRITIVNDGRNLFALTYTDTSPRVAKAVIDSLVNLFVESNLGNSRKDLSAARNFIDEQIADYRRQLDEMEKRLAEFKAKNAGYLPGENNYGSQLDSARAELQRTDAELAETLKQKEALQKQMESIPPLIDAPSESGPDLGSGPPLGPALDDSPGGDNAGQIAELKAKIKTLLLTFTDSYPDVVAAKRQLAQAEAEAKKESEQAAKDNTPKTQTASAPAKATAPNPLYDQLKLQLVNLETTIASLQSRKERDTADVKRLQGLAQAVPAVGAQMAQLTRDYEIVRRSYEELLNRREAARIGQSMQSQTQAISFRIIDPPNVDPQPVGPKRTLFMSGILVAGLLAGLAFAFGLSQLDEGIRSADQLRSLTGYPILGTIAVILPGGWQRQQFLSGIALAVGVLGLFVAYFGWLFARGLLHMTA